MKLAAAALVLTSYATAGGVSSEIFRVDPSDWLHQCAQTFQTYGHVESGFNEIDRSNSYLIGEPAGLCADALTCAFDKCHGVEYLECLLLGKDPETGSLSPPNLQDQTFEEALGVCGVTVPSALPQSITFPKTAFDVVNAVKYAVENDMQVSVKSTGHSCTGAHTKAGTLMINMRDFANYTHGDNSVIECNDVRPNENPVLGDACVLANARGMNAYIRVGGGQIWSDVYNALIDASEAGKTGKLYGVAGGGAGTVGASGGWLMGGGLSYGYERQYGIGVDQILELELVLPNAVHVKIFPSKWNMVEGYVNPQTSEVTAMCNGNVSDEEAEWDWHPCSGEELNVPPEDLWRALRGGGGGTYGIVTSVKYQLFDQEPIHVIFSGLYFMEETAKAALKYKFEADKSGELEVKVSRLYTLFLVDLVHNPSHIGIREGHCGAPDIDFKLHEVAKLLCWGNTNFETEIKSAWGRVVDASNVALQDRNIAEIMKESMFQFRGQGKSFLEVDKEIFKGILPNYDDIFPKGLVPDIPRPGFQPPKGFNTYCSFNLPLGLLQSNDEHERDMVFKVLSSVSGGHSTGGQLAQLGDGMDAVSPSERVPGQASLSIQDAIDKHDILEDLLQSVYKYTNATEFPGFYEYNHICPDAKTPSRSDSTQDCDPEKDGDCYSIQEAVWGTELYATLQSIKTAIDPGNLLDCYPCVKPFPAEEDHAVKKDNLDTKRYFRGFREADSIA